MILYGNDMSIWRDSKFLWLLFAAGLVAVLEFFSLAGIHLPVTMAQSFFFILILIIGSETLWHGLKALATLNFKSINALMLIAVAGAWYLGKYEEAAVVIVLYTLAEKLEDIGIQKSQSALEGLFQQMPKEVFVKDLGRTIPVTELKVGHIIIIKPSEMIPADGKVVGGSSFVDESTITGEPIPQDKIMGDEVYSGTFNKEGALEVEVTKDPQNSTLAKIKTLTYEAGESKAPTQQFIESFSTYYTPAIILLALLWVLVPPLLFNSPFDLWLARGLALIVIACPCALVISTPISIFSAIGNASKEGALIKGGKYLEAIGQIKAIALDKTRTLTYGRPIVSDIIPFGSHTKENVLECAAGIEMFSEHPLAQSIVEAAKKENLNVHAIENFLSVVGKGAKADCLVCSTKHHCLGKLAFILEEHPVPPLILDEIDMLQRAGKTPVVLATHHDIEGVIALTDEIRPESKKLIERLLKMGICPVLLTGDHLYSAKNVADTLGIREVHAELLPEDKAKQIQNMIKKYQQVAMVGDGVNDAPALALSNVGITLGSLGSDIAIEAASIIIMHDRLDIIPFLIKLGRKTLSTVRLNVAFAIAIKAIFIFLALVGLSNLALAIFADVGVTLIVILISLRLMKWKPVKHEQV